SEERERERWRAIVAEVLDDVANRDGCFQALHDHFTHPESWCCEKAARTAIKRLRGAGYGVGLASNFDQRLRGVVKGLRPLRGVQALLISSEVGWKKPSSQFFSRLAASRNLEPDQVLLVGDDVENDFAGAREAGMHALLFDPRMRYPLLQSSSI